MSENNISQEKDQELLNLLKGLQEMVAGSGYSISDIFKAGADALGITDKLQVQPETSTVATPVVEQAEPAVSYQETQPVVAESTDSAEIQMSEEELKDFLADCYDKKLKYEEAIIGYYGNIQLADGLREAKAGTIRPGELDNLEELEALPKESREEYLTSAYQISFLNRERAYAYYKFASPEEIERVRSSILNLYRGLKEKAQQNFNIYEANNVWKMGEPTITAEDQRRFQDGRHKWSGLGAGVGSNADAKGVIYDRNECLYTPQAFDTKYRILGSYLSIEDKLNRPFKNLFQSYQSDVDGIIKSVETMSVDEVRQFKIDQIILEPEELERINKDVKEFKYGKQETPQTP